MTTCSDSQCELSIVMPCLNESETLETCILKAQQSLRELNVAGEIVIADNGSTDGSQNIATQLGARLVRVENKGYGAALEGGIAARSENYRKRDLRRTHVNVCGFSNSDRLSVYRFCCIHQNFCDFRGTVSRRPSAGKSISLYFFGGWVACWWGSFACWTCCLYLRIQFLGCTFFWST